MFLLLTVLLVFIISNDVSTSLNICTTPDKVPRFNSTRIFNVAPLGSLIQQIQITSLMLCVRECILQTNCAFFNYNLTSGNCQLRREYDIFSYIHENKIWSHYYGNISHWNPVIAGNCAGAKCPPNYKCWPNIMSSNCYNGVICTSEEADGRCYEKYRCKIGEGGQLCILLDCGLPPGYEYPTRIAWKLNGTTISSMAKYQNPNNATLKCQPNGIWAGEIWPQLPATCEDIKNETSIHVDGEFWLYPVKFGGKRRVRINCRFMDSTSPSEYLTLKQTNTTSSAFIQACVGQNETVRKFRKLRLHIENMSIKIEQDDVLQSNQSTPTTECKSWSGTCSNIFTGMYVNLESTGLMFNISNRSAINWPPPLSKYEINYTCTQTCTYCLPLEISLVLSDATT